MKHQILLKTVSIAIFISLIILFVLYRSGKFDTNISSDDPTLQNSPNGGVVKANKKDTIPVVEKDSSKRLLMPSSKTIILSDKNLKISDSLKKKNKKDSTRRSKEIMFSSSKSGYIITSSDLKKQLDSIKTDTTKETKKNKKKNELY